MKIKSALTIAALFLTSAGTASAAVVTVGSQDGPWNPGVIGNPAYGSGDNLPPAAVSITSGANITITYVSGLTSAFGGVDPTVDANGYVGGVFGSGVGLTGIGSSNTPLPSFAIDPTNVGPDINLAELIGDFTNSAGLLIGGPFAVGDGPFSITAPLGATMLQLGLNDDIFSDNSGALLIDVAGGNSPVPEPATWAMLLLGCAGLALAGRSAARQTGITNRASV